MKERKKERKESQAKRKRGVAVKKKKAKNRIRGVKVPILNLPRPPCPVLVMNDE